MKVLLTAEEIHHGVRRLADELAGIYGERPIMVVGVMTGCIVFLTDLMRLLPMPLHLGFVQASSYRGQSTEPGALTTRLDWLPDVSGRHVLLLDDIFDTGHTLAKLVDQLQAQRPASLRTAVLLRKEGRQQTAMRPDHAVFDIPDAFVIGYGLDYDDHYRHLPYVAVLEEADLAATPSATRSPA